MSDDKIRITDLPVGTWTMPYTSFLETLVDGIVDNKTGKRGTPVLKDISSICTEVNVDITVTFPKGKLSGLEETVDATGCNGVEKYLNYKLQLALLICMFDKDCKLHKYRSG